MEMQNYLKIVKFFGLYHAVAISPLVLPVVSEWFLNLLGSAHGALELSGEWLSVSPSSLMFVNLFASAALVWALYRFFHPSAIVGRYEGWGMLLFSIIVLFYVFNGASVIWLVIPLVDLPGGILHLLSGRRSDS